MKWIFRERDFFDVFRKRMHLKFLNQSCRLQIIRWLRNLKIFMNIRLNQIKQKLFNVFLTNKTLFSSQKQNMKKIWFCIHCLFWKSTSSFCWFFLNVLKMNQNKIIQRLNANVNSCILNDEIIIVTLLNEIKTKTYFHILTSSKLALFNVLFKKVLQNFEFCDRICFVVIDEMHLMKDWFN
jgi:hypothetical protein